jgi:hypothetical protein
LGCSKKWLIPVGQLTLGKFTAPSKGWHSVPYGAVHHRLPMPFG